MATMVPAGKARTTGTALEMLRSSPPAAVNVEACRELATVLTTLTIPPDREEMSLLELSPQAIGNFYLLLVAICHQTSPRDLPPLEGSVNGRHLRGWDFLSAKLAAAVRADPAMLAPASWSRVSPETVRELFRDAELGERLSDPDGRALLVNDLGRGMLQSSWEHADQLYDAASGRIAGGTGLLQLLARFRAYSDPVRKKSLFYLALMRNSGLWSYADPEHLGAPIDYHEVRGHLRIGTVEIRDAALRAKLSEGREVTPEEDVSIRGAVQEALALLAENSGVRDLSRLHYMFWNVFRSCCTRESPHCDACPPTCDLPSRYVSMSSAVDGERRCPFQPACKSAGCAVKMVEHRIETDFF
jgi:hypothetical protein